MARKKRTLAARVKSKVKKVTRSSKTSKARKKKRAASKMPKFTFWFE